MRDDGFDYSSKEPVRPPSYPGPDAFPLVFILILGLILILYMARFG